MCLIHTSHCGTHLIQSDCSFFPSNQCLTHPVTMVWSLSALMSNCTKLAPQCIRLQPPFQYFSSVTPILALFLYFYVLVLSCTNLETQTFNILMVHFVPSYHYSLVSRYTNAKLVWSGSYWKCTPTTKPFSGLPLHQPSKLYISPNPLIRYITPSVVKLWCFSYLPYHIVVVFYISLS